MKKIIFVFAIIFIALFPSCDKNESILESIAPQDNNQLLVENSDYKVINGRIVFESSKKYFLACEKLLNSSQTELTKWNKSIRINTLKQKYDSENITYQYNVDYEPIPITNNHVGGIIPYLFNEEGVLQYSDTILLIKDEKIITIMKGGYETVKLIKNGAEINKLENIAVKNHTIKLRESERSTDGAQKFKERSSIVYLASNIRQYVYFEGNLVTISQNRSYVEFKISGYQQNKFLFWWGPTSSPLAWASIKFNGTVGGVSCNFKGDKVYDVEELSIGTTPPVITISPPYIDITVTFEFNKNRLLSGSKSVYYTGYNI